MTSAYLFQPLKVGTMTLKQRIAMAPLTRFRADEQHIHGAIATQYYEQRASVPGTLIVSEGTFIAPKAGGLAHVPGIWSEAQIQAWKKVVDAVHAKSSFIYLQLWALGRGARPADLQAEGFDYVSSSATPIAPGAPAPRALTVPEIHEYSKLYAEAAKIAVEQAGFDGVEIHGANGYLVDQFLQDVANTRTDEYGGSIENRCRFPLEVVQAVSDAVGQERTAIRLSPYSKFNAMGMDDPKPTFSHFAQSLRSKFPDLAYLHLTRPQVSGDNDNDVANRRGANDFLHKIWLPKPLLVSGALTADTIDEVMHEDGVVATFGRYFISNPDLPDRIRHNIPFTPYNRATFYLRGPQKSEGYTDYPFAEHSKI